MFHLSILFCLVGFIVSSYADGLYTKNSPVLQVNAQNYENLIALSNHTSILEFYAPWCGHCQNLKPAYEKAARSLAGLAKVAAINCDDDSNKFFCNQMGVQGFPTLKIIKPGPKPGKPVVEDYNGPRTAKAIVDTVVERIPNHVKRLQDNTFESWLGADTANPRAILFTERGTISALIKSLAVDFLGVIDFAQIRSKETEAVGKYGITQFPSLVLITPHSPAPIIYSGEMKKGSMLEFLSQAGSPNTDPAPKKPKMAASPNRKSSSSTTSPVHSRSNKAMEEAGFEAEDFLEILLDDNTPLESPLPIVDFKTPVPVPELVPPISMLSTPDDLRSACLTPTSGNCLLVLLPSGTESDVQPDSAATVLTALAQIAHKHAKRRAKMFPFYSVSPKNEAGKTLRNDLGLRPENELEMIAINMKRGWWRLYANDNLAATALESFVDSIKLGEGTKNSLPEGFFLQDEATNLGSTAADPGPDSEPIAQVPHDEL